MGFGWLLRRNRLVRLAVRSFADIAPKSHPSASGTQDSDVRVRFAPSPTGFLHIGGLRTALLNYLFARSKGGRFVIRIEDTDQKRIVPGAVENLLAQLRWAGIEPDEGPSIGGEYGPYVDKLLENGSAYRCFCSQRRIDVLRRDQIRRKEQTRYDNRCRELSPAEIHDRLETQTPFVVRLKLRKDSGVFNDILNGEIRHEVALIEGDPVIQKSDGYPTYHLANVVDDHLMKITHVLRGKEWMVSTCKHVILYDAFGWQAPEYAHLPLFNNEDGKKLSKRQGDVFVEHYRKKGYLPASVLSFVVHYGAGFSEESGTIYGDAIASPESCVNDMVQRFKLEKVGIQNSVIRLSKLDEYNSGIIQHLMKHDEGKGRLVSDLRYLVSETYRTSSLLTKFASEESLQYLERLLTIRKTHISTINDLVSEEYCYVWVRPDIQLDELGHEYIEFVRKACGFMQDQYSEGLDDKEVTAFLRGAAEEVGLKMPPAMATLRYLLIGRRQGPAVAEIFRLLGREEALYRLQKVDEFIGQRTDSMLE